MVSSTTLRILAVVLFAALIAQIWSDSTESPGAADNAAAASDVAKSTTSTLPDGNEEAPVDDSTDEVGISTTTTVPLAKLTGLSLEMVTNDVTWPVAIAAPVGDPRLFIVDRVGIIYIVEPSQGGQTSTFLDLRDRVLSAGIEQGLLGLAFHPDYADNRRFYTYHINEGGNRFITEFTATEADPDLGDPGSGRVLWERPPPSDDLRHFGGHLQFGPDGFLWVSVGDGARASINGQDPGNFYGTVQRLDVDSADPYGIPADNPFVDGGGAPETWAFGLRNPWRIAVDPVDRLVYIADVGQAMWEEIDIVSIDTGGGSNFGWPITEGNSCFNANDCNRDGLTMPIVEYGHDEGCSLTGGFVYRGAEIPEIDGHYFYSDWCTGFVRSFVFVDGEATQRTDWSEQLPEAGQVNTYGLDGFGELYIANNDGEVYKIVADR